MGGGRFYKLDDNKVDFLEIRHELMMMMMGRGSSSSSSIVVI